MSIAGKVFLFGLKFSVFFKAAVGLLVCLVLNLLASLHIQADTAENLEVISAANAALLREQASIAHGPWQLVNALAWSPDGQFLAASVGDMLHLHRIADQQTLASVTVGALTQALSFSPDGSLLAAGSRDGRLRIWRLETLLAGGEPHLLLDAHKKGVNCLAFHPGGGQLASGGNDAVARLWDAASGELLATAIGGTFAVPGIAFSPDGALLAVVNGDSLRLREFGSERIVGTFKASASLYGVAFSPDGELLAAGDTENGARIWNVDTAFRTGQEKYPPGIELAGHTGYPGTYHALVWRVVFSPDGDLLASAGGDGTLRLWDMPSGDLLNTLAGHTAGVTALAFRPDGRLLVSGSLDGFIRFWGISP